MMISFHVPALCSSASGDVKKSCSPVQHYLKVHKSCAESGKCDRPIPPDWTGVSSHLFLDGRLVGVGGIQCYVADQEYLIIASVVRCRFETTSLSSAVRQACHWQPNGRKDGNSSVPYYAEEGQGIVLGCTECSSSDRLACSFC
ncbi:unnamed protein product, partial [Gongylonema pulchrum]|uniref:Sema domain-containing protein n=1 Tax=Gongylonema pulchrum TaxID=637853 RepID=A0A183EMY7_9BILA